MSSKLKSLVIRIAPVVLLALAPGWLQAAGSFTQIIVFGDSLSDYGNNNIYDKAGIPTSHPESDPPTQLIGTWVKQLATQLNLPLEVSGKGGSNYAWSGATTGTVGYTADPDNLIDFKVINHGIETQIKDYFAAHPQADPGALYIISGGGNDFLAEPTPTKSRASASALLARIRSLTEKGAKTIMLVNIPSYENAPFVKSMLATFQGITPAKLKIAVESYNARLSQGLLELQGQFPEVRFVEVDMDIKFREVVAHPEQYKLENVTEPSRKAKVDPDKYLFWDPLHPTARAHEILADYALTLLAMPPGLIASASFDPADIGWKEKTWSGGTALPSGLGIPGVPSRGGAWQVATAEGASRAIDPDVMPFTISFLDNKDVKKLGAPAAATSPLTRGSVVWLSFLMQPDEDDGEGAKFAALSLKSGSEKTISLGLVEKQAHWGLKAGEVVAASEVQAVTGKPVLLVARIRFVEGKDNDEVDLFVNPPVAEVEPTQASASIRNLDLGKFDTVEIAGSRKSSFDEIKLGRTWASVLPK